MPAQEFAWPGDVRVPDLQLYGTKRKAPPPPDTQHNTDHAMKDMNAAKRACPWGALSGAGDQEVAMETPMENNNHLVSLHPEGPPSQQIPWQQEIYSQTQNTAPWQLQASHQQPQPTPPQAGGVMDLCGETFAHPPPQPVVISESQDALMAMDSDCVPDPAQYNLPVSQASSPTTADSSADTRAAYCNQYCGLGDLSPSSSRVRCYCKPSWEGMLSMRPYISDIY